MNHPDIERQSVSDVDSHNEATLEAEYGTTDSALLQSPLAAVKGWLRGTVGVDRAIGFTVLARFWTSSAGLVTVLLIAKFLSRAEQGYYYTFSSLVALQIVFELGFSFVILQMASHERAHLTISPDQQISSALESYYYTFSSLVALQIVFELGFSFVILQMASHERAHLTISPDQQISGDIVAHRRLASVIQKSVRWYSLASFLLVTALLTAGSYFFSAHHQQGPAVSWRIPWYADAIAATIAFQLDPILSFLEGCGFVANVARLRLIQATIGSSLAWLALITHHGLLAPAMMIVGIASTTALWLIGKRKLLLGLLRFDPGPDRIQWWKEVWPFQWRIALSWLSGYVFYSGFY